MDRLYAKIYSNFDRTFCESRLWSVAGRIVAWAIYNNNNRVFLVYDMCCVFLLKARHFAITTTPVDACDVDFYVNITYKYIHEKLLMKNIKRERTS